LCYLLFIVYYLLFIVAAVVLTSPGVTFPRVVFVTVDIRQNLSTLATATAAAAAAV
jgi:hypothetical protein